MKTAVRAVTSLAAVAVAAIAVYNLAERVRYDRTLPVVGVVAEWCAGTPMDGNTAARIAAAGATGVAIDLETASRCDPAWFSRNGLFVILTVDMDRPFDEDAIAREVDRFGDTLFTASVIPYDPLRCTPAQYRFRRSALERHLGAVRESRRLPFLTYEHTPSHAGSPDTPSAWMLRAFRYDPFRMADVRSVIRRAVGERGCRLVQVACPPFVSDGDRRAAIVAVVASLSSLRGVRSGRPKPVAGRWISLGMAGEVLAFLIACVVPLAACRWAVVRVRGGDSPVLAWLYVSLASLAAGLCIAGLLQSDAMITGAAAPRGVRLAMLAPLGLAPLVLYTSVERRAFLTCPVTYGDVLRAGAVVAGLGVLWLRSGNDGGILVPGFERAARDALEGVVLARPRIKEALLGHPLMLAGLRVSAVCPGSPYGRLLVWCGILGSISMINTFIHVHTPLSISVVRTVAGMVVGVGPGMLLGHVLCTAVRRRADA